MSNTEEMEQMLSELRRVRPEMVQLVEFKDAILRLSENTDFRHIIEKEFMTEDALRLARGIGDPSLDTKQQADMISMAAASGHLKRFLSARVQMGFQAERNIEEIDEQLEELRKEGIE